MPLQVEVDKDSRKCEKMIEPLIWKKLILASPSSDRMDTMMKKEEYWSSVDFQSKSSHVTLSKFHTATTINSSAR